MTDAEILQGLLILLLALIGCITCLVLLSHLIWFLVRPIYRVLFVSKEQRLLEDLTLQLNQASDDYLNETLASLHKYRR
jgi:flagellar biosynthesis/type III secretory pathway M-ring protein FliF/YscJ